MKRRKRKRKMNIGILQADTAALEHRSGILEFSYATVILFAVIMAVGVLLCVGIAAFASHRQLRKLREEIEEKEHEKDK